MYEIYLDVTGINGSSGITDKKIVAKPENSNFAQYIVYNNYTQNSNNLIYNFTLTKTGNTQWSYIKNSTLFLKPKFIDGTPTGLDINESNWVEADDSFKFEFPLNLENKDGEIQIFKKALPNGTYDVWCEAEDLLGNKTVKDKIIKKTVKWKYNNIGNISHKIYNTGETMYTTIHNVVKTESDEPIYNTIGKIIGDYTPSENYTCTKEIVDVDTQVISWIVSNPSEMDKIQFKLEFCEDPTVEGSVWQIVSNEKKPHGLWETENKIEVKSLTGKNYDFVIDNDDTTVKKYQYSFVFPHANYPDGSYKATMSHILDMSDFVGERKIETITPEIKLSYNVPKITIDEIKPIFKFNKTSKSWQPYVVFSMSCTKNDVTDVTLNFEYLDDSKTSETILFKNELEKPVEVCFNGQNEFGVYCMCRDSKDTMYKRFEKQPKIKNFKRTSTEFLKSHTSIPDFEDNLDLFGIYKDDTGKKYNGIDVQTQSSIDVFRTHRCIIDDVDYFKYVEDGIEANYFDDVYYTKKQDDETGEEQLDIEYRKKYSYFMSKKFIPVTLENDLEVLDEENTVKRIV